MKKILLASTVALSLAFAPTQAQSAPIAGLIAGGLGLGTVGTTLLGAAISIGANWLIQKLFAEEPKPQGIKQNMDSGGDNPISFIVGKYATPGKLVYVNTYGNDNKQLVMVINLSEIAITALSSKMVVNGRVCDIDFEDTDAHGFAKVQQYQKGDKDYLGVRFFNDPNSAPNYLTNNFGSDPLKPWTNDMVGKGCSYVIVRCRFSPDGGVWSGIPTFKFAAQGIPLYDLRKDSTAGGSGSHRWNDRSTYEYSENCAVISYNILRGIRRNGETIYGGNAAEEQLPYDIWAAAMNTCDENVPLKAGGTGKKFTMGAEISVDVPPLDTLREIDNSCSGWTNEFGGIWKMFVGSPGASVVSITDDDIISTMEQTDDLFKPLQDTFNVAQASYPEPEACWEMKDAPTRFFNNYIEEDGEELSLNMEFPFVFERNQVQRLMRAAVKESRRQRVHTIVLPPAFARLECYDVFTWDSSRNGYIDKRFLIIQKEELLNCCQQVICRELDPNDYDWNAIADEFDSYDPTTDSTDPVTPVLEFAVEADFIDRPGTGKDKPAILVTWDWAEEDLNIRLIQWRIRRTGKTKIIGKGHIRDYQDGEELITHRALRFGDQYDIQFRILPRRKQAKSVWTDWQAVMMLAIDVPTGLTLTAQSKLNGDGHIRAVIKADWNDVDQANNGYGLKITVDGEEDLRRTDGSKYKFQVDTPSTVSVAVRTRASDGGTPSGYCTPVVLTVTKKLLLPTTPTGFEAKGKHRRVVLIMDDHPDADFKRWIVYFSKVNNFSAGTTKSKHSKSNRIVLDDLDNKETYYIWVTAEDKSGNESAKFPSGNTAGIPVTTVKLDDDDTEDDALSAPTGLSVTKIQDTDEDGTIRTFLELDCTAPGWVTPKTSYAYSVLVGSKEYKKKSDDTLARFEVLKTGIAHTVKVRAIKGHGNRSAWSGSVSLTPGKKTGLPTTASGLSALSKLLSIRLRWNKCTDKDYKETVVYRNTVNNFATAIELDRVKASSYKDEDNLVAGTTYYYWVAHVDRSDNIGLNSNGTSEAWKLIDDTDTDSTVLSAPTSLNVTKVQEKDEDGTIRTFLKMTCTAPGWATAKTTYVFEVSVGSDTYTVKSDDTKAQFRVNKTGVLHAVRVRAVKGHGNKSSWSGTASLTPTKKSADASAVTGVSTHKKNGDIIVKWTPTADRDNAEYIVRRATTNSYGASTEIARIKGTRYRDNDVNTKGTTYYYFIDTIDTSGNLGSSASASVNNTETGIGTSDTDATVLAAPTGISLSQLNRDVDQDGTVDIALRATFSGAVSGAAGYEVWWEDNAGQSATVRADSGSWWFIANTTKSYRVRWRTINWVGTPGAWSSYTSYVTPSPVTGAPPDPVWQAFSPIVLGFQVLWIAPTVFDYAYTEIAIGSSPSTPGSIVATSSANNNFVMYPGTGTLYAWLRHVNTSGLKSNWVRSTSGNTPSQVSDFYLAANSVSRTQLVVGAAGETSKANLGTSGTGSTSVSASCTSVLSVATFKATSTTAGVTITLEGDSWTVDLTDQKMYTFVGRRTGGGNVNLSKSGGGTISGCVLVVVGVY
jgi:hypothetical protein